MRRIIADIYKIVYGITKMGGVSIFIALAYATLVSFFILNGLFLLVEDWLPTRVLLKGFQYPYYAGTLVVLFLLFLWQMLPLKNLSKERKKKTYYWPLFAFTLTAIISFVYIHYHGQLS